MSMSDDLLSTTAPFSPAPTQPSQPVLPTQKTSQKPGTRPISLPPGAQAPATARRHHVRQDKGSDDDGDGDSDDGDVPRDLRPVPAERDLYSVNAFCARNSISRDKLYELWRQGLGPETVRIGNRQLITRESAARWRKVLERAERERKRKEG
jgi:hypothetical protein